jgi:hypothetical protein
MHKKNSGIAVINRSCTNMPHKTVLVMGVPRGGTSMVAGAVSKLGVFMGPEFKIAPFYENPELEICAKTKKKIEAKKIILGYNELYPTWGFKVLPRGWSFWLFKPMFREPVYIVVFRDILAIANRRAVSLDKSLLKEMFVSNWHNLCLLLFLAFTKRPTLILSYEKALLSPEDFVKGLAKFLEINNHSKIEEAIQFITPSPANYLMRSDSNYFGYLDHVDSTKIAGWALSLADKNPIKIEILINGQLNRVIEACSKREDVLKANARFREDCGFVVVFNEQNKLNKGDCVEVRILEKNIQLINSPYIIS